MYMRYTNACIKGTRVCYLCVFMYLQISLKELNMHTRQKHWLRWQTGQSKILLCMLVQRLKVLFRLQLNILKLFSVMLTCVYTYTHIHINTYTHIHIYTYTHKHIYTYTHIHIYTYTHIHIYTDTHIHINKQFLSLKTNSKTSL